MQLTVGHKVSALAATAGLHQIAGEMFVERLNANGGLLGRPVEWRILDDASDQAQVAGLYEQLILPVLRQRNPQARSDAAARLDALETLGGKLRAAMMRSVLRRYLEL